jgi:predicted methyltransferase
MAVDEDSGAASDDVLRARLEKCRQDWGIDFRPLEIVLCELAEGDWCSLAWLVSASTASRRAVTDLVRLLRPWIEQEGERVRLAPDARALVTETLDCQGLSSRAVQDPFERAALTDTGLLQRMSEISQGLPPSIWNLDHVPATDLTRMKRALFLDHTLRLSGAHLLCLGDHDLTSVAVCLLRNDLTVTVVDIDERILSYIGQLATEHGWPIRTLFADLRVNLPRSIHDTADVVFTDPPYTPSGTRLFLERGVAGLRQSSSTRLAFCYGFNERQLGQGLGVQEALHDLRLAPRAILPGFNRYDGAQSIGSASALWVYQPTRRTWAAARSASVDPRIYTRGQQAEESEAQALSREVQEVVRAALPCDGGLVVLVGQVLGEEFQGVGKTVGLAEYLDDPGRHDQADVPVVANLLPAYGHYLIRVLLVAPSASPIFVILPDRELRRSGLLDSDDPLSELIGASRRIRIVRQGRGSSPCVVLAEHAPPPEDDTVFVLRSLTRRRRSKLANAWREALIECADQRGRRLTKNEARAAIQDRYVGEVYGGCFLTELPLHALRALVSDVRATVGTLRPARETPVDRGGVRRQ